MRRTTPVRVALAAWLAIVAAAPLAAAQPGSPVELGKVTWLRNFDEAHAAAKKSGKPILLLFQEVPG